ncbi:MAG TPA: DinB family protein [Thermoanaerobaculia bacterium]|nr:DinB family protein [Thermoanaerobaculia bacterium]
MHPAAEALIAELEAESPATRRVLERVPGDRLEWRPHPKSMSLGQLAQHVAALPASISRLAQQDGLDAATVDFEPEPAESAEAVLATFDASVAEARDYLSGLTEETATAPWTLTHGERKVFSLPRIGLMRTLAFNHLYHHRGQLTVYLRLLGVPVPAVYGKSADENPLAAAAAGG